MAVWMDHMANHGAVLYGRPTKSCHLLADTTEELIEFAKSIGLKERWIQHPGTPKEHFDIMSQRKVNQAIRLGAEVLNRRDFVQKLVEKRRSHASS